MKEIPCPSCGAPVPFISAVSVFAVCSYCQSMVVRQDLNLQLIGEKAFLPEDMSPLQLGTQGIYRGTPFTLAGRTIQTWDRGHWTEWFALMSDGRHGWLAEAQGFFMISFPLELTEGPPHPSDIKPGQVIPLKGEFFHVDDIKTSVCTAVEGELPFAPPYKEEKLSVDLVGIHGPNRAFASLEYSDEGVRAYVGEYLDYEHFKFSYTREFEGWPTR
ncbi:MAG TPA: DUF4178 domain-containing protein [Candidatus Methylacidiphilales bacterium]|nr:DUF4178 domain-containing protein [Candidatus Methylacidiphilales bacterium]